MSCLSQVYFVTDFSYNHSLLHANLIFLAHLPNKSDFGASFFFCPCAVAPSAPFVFPGHGGRDPTGSCRTTCKHENPRPQSEPEAPSLREQPDPAQAETPGVTAELGLEGQPGASWDGWERALGVAQAQCGWFNSLLVLLTRVMVARCGFSARMCQ